jgi:hypothetical protein
MAGESRIKVPAGFIEVLREMVLNEQEVGREVIVAALREQQAIEWERLRRARGRERRAVWWNLKRIGAFMSSVAAEKEA